MISLFLLNESISDIEFGDFQSGIDDLILIDSDKDDIFFKNSNVYNIDNYLGLCENYSQENQFRIEFLEKLENHDSNPQSVDDLRKIFPKRANGFLGIDFSKICIEENLCVANNNDFSIFKEYYTSLVTFSNFKDLKQVCFPNIIFSQDSENQLIAYGESKYFKQCIEQFEILEKYLKSWGRGNFSYQDLNDKTAITISPESTTTMRKYRDDRVFSLPDGGTGVFELHIKLGNIRIHLLEDNIKKKIIIGYIGKHLKI